MSLFSKPKVVLWPKAESVEVYIDRKENNNLSFDINLWEEKSEKDLGPLFYYLKQNKIESCSVLIPDDILLTKSFIYDTKITEIDKKEVIGLAESFVQFKIDPDSIEYTLLQEADKTIIQSTISQKKKIDTLKLNLAKLNLKINSLTSVSASISKVISSLNSGEFFLIYPLNSQEYTLLLSRNNVIYLTANLKGPSLDIQKTINYSTLYFGSITKKIYVPDIKEVEILSTTDLEKTTYNETQIAQSRGKASNLPLPVLGELISTNSTYTDIIKQPTDISLKKPMENKKNILPIVAVFIFTAALASIIIYIVLTRNKTEDTQSPASDTQSQIEETIPTIEPVATIAPTIAEISKALKLQVLNATEINGQAATVKSELAALGFTSIAVGNSKEAVTSNQVKLKASLSTASAYFKSKMDANFPATYTSDLPASSQYDAVFIIGTDLSTGAAATLKTTVTPTVAKTTVTPTVTKTATPSVTKAPTAVPTVR
ncbi:MAG: LytR C-terminal domain-containing protein [Candidatus Shapirobacteria bacterium]